MLREFLGDNIVADDPETLSAHSGEGVEEALRAVLKVIAKSRREEAKEREEAWRP